MANKINLEIFLTDAQLEACKKILDSKNSEELGILGKWTIQSLLEIFAIIELNKRIEQNQYY
jgi:hypothetical protein